MQPERHPADDDDQRRGNVDLNQVETKTPRELYVTDEPRVVAGA